MIRAVFLDRDGVVNDAVMRDGKPYPPASMADLRVAADAAEVLRRLKALGLMLIVITNQPDVARGQQTTEGVETIHKALGRLLPIDAFYTCFHDDAENCRCRKPRPGLIVEAANRFGADLAASFVVGDRWRDIEAGYAAGCQTIWIDRGYRERGPSIAPSARVASLRDAADWIAAALDRA